jgi:undecaprenyl diphosphate synthase
MPVSLVAKPPFHSSPRGQAGPQDKLDQQQFRNVKREALPQHIAIIMDGNGRWARRRHLPRIAGHQAGVQSVRAVVEECARLRIPALTLYAFSAENWKRPRTEVSFLMELLSRYLREEVKELNENDIRLEAIGRQSELPERVQRDLSAAREATRNNRGMVLTLALNYGARSELVDAFQSIVRKAASNGGFSHLRIDEEAIARHLYTAGLPDPDLLIRTSGEMRISNFLLWQIAYAEIYVTETMWPDFRRDHLLAAIADFQKRERRYGGLSKSGEQQAAGSGDR